MRNRIGTAIAMACLLTGYAVLGCGVAKVQQQNAALSAAIRSYQYRFSQMIGEAEGFGQYSLVTLDGGIKWWNFHVEPVGGEGDKEAVIIDGPADELLLLHLKGDGK